MSFRVEDLFQSKTPTRPNQLFTNSSNTSQFSQFPSTPDTNVISCAQLEQSVQAILDSPMQSFLDTPGSSGIRRSQRKPLRHKPSIPEPKQNTSVTTTSAEEPQPSSNYTIPASIVDNLCWRFLHNIPDDERQDPIRIMFALEQAHWFYVDLYCENNDNPIQCENLSFRDFVKQMFESTDMLKKFKHHADLFIDQFRDYKSVVPTYGAVMFNESLTEILLVQSYFSTKNNWGFPKGKVNQDEEPATCAIREVLEETGYDIGECILKDVTFQYTINETKICLFAATNVRKDFKFHPHLRKEIRKIAWFPIKDLPTHRHDTQACAHHGFTPKNFYMIIPVVEKIKKFAASEKKKLFSLNKQSAFQPVIPKGKPPNHLSQAYLESIFMSESPNPLSPQFPSTSSQFPKFPTSAASASAQLDTSPLFAPLRLNTDAQPRTSHTPNSGMTGESFLKLLLTPNQTNELPSQAQEIKHPKPIHSSSILPGQLSFTSPEPSFSPALNNNNYQRKTPGHKSPPKHRPKTEDELLLEGFITPPLLLPADLLASSPANSEAAAKASAQAYLETYGKALRESVRRKPKKNRRRRKTISKTSKSDDEPPVQTTPKRRMRLMDNEASSSDSNSDDYKDIPTNEDQMPSTSRFSPDLHSRDEEDDEDESMEGTDHSKSEKEDTFIESDENTKTEEAEQQEYQNVPTNAPSNNVPTNIGQSFEALSSFLTPANLNGNGVTSQKIQLCEAWKTFKLDIDINAIIDEHLAKMK